jgi:hypothetical protein
MRESVDRETDLRNLERISALERGGKTALDAPAKMVLDGVTQVDDPGHRNLKLQA